MLNSQKLAWGLPLTVVSLLWAMIPVKSAAQGFPSYRLTVEADYARCVRELEDAGVSPRATATACGMAIRPTSIGECVTLITRDAGIAGDEAVLGCMSVRRPQELANCVVNITRSNSEANALTVLEGCGRSLLPERYASCVVGMGSGSTEFAVNDLLRVCLNPPEQFSDMDRRF
ncbi:MULTISPECIES: hypothetical protein [Arthrospira]|uniref:Uncharacterized protein n=1 Tax=Limnospira platensis NIES-46 TaxID=1236695 RepID=A0A5M3TCS0_LIMPL|nr:hypothetical protein [Arthrospira platensis]AMW30921.1 hypothetical protein AP285_26330 [Arthrospira platensis YZ]KDR58847.1 hypothetical protein APPUASWS_002635 [Arthrospira platensis str. Paraca]MBD2667763.1 hypothetical protein [Arthrospira platensis FACHB-439]MBD2711123.1 hypothetical protein [Arthrospira platensis FACHB-835]MDF2208267.1 hypothetical protein [Arthrospira platensis NCB002]MDT9183917.1 hypothetical protein [Limnospira sp. PMC 289.06]MDT9295793.1 hypothetical protein [Ar